MGAIKKLVVSAAAVIMLFSLMGCTVIGVSVGALAGAGTSVGMAGGAVIGGVVGYEVSK
jgi:uncharacterized lipoprotein NlpE involved in copper resistance